MRERITEIMDAGRPGKEREKGFERWRGMVGWKFRMWAQVSRHVEMNRGARRRIMWWLIGWTYQEEEPGHCARILRKFLKSEAATSADAQWMLERGATRWGAKELNAALKRGIDKADYRTYWHRLARETTMEYFDAVRALRAQKIWCPAEQDEERLTKFLNHPERLTQDEHIRLLMYAKELQLIPKKRLSKYRKDAYRMYGKAQTKLAWRKAILRPPLRDDGLPPPHRTLNDLLPEALKESQRLCQEGKEPPATKEELFTLFRRSRVILGANDSSGCLFSCRVTLDS
jgi:hypothetical protein